MDSGPLGNLLYLFSAPMRLIGLVDNKTDAYEE